jgi:phenylpropionate dioxygenase-like ring-hydroxylating dioxygenase large terminal subunit
MERFPFPIPYSWYQVAYPGDLEPGGVTALKYWDRDLVLWRDEAGDFHLQDAFCPHLGAHLGVGGEVERGCIRCPFHGWAFDGAGECTNIPYSDRVNRKAKLRTYPVVVRNDLVFAWYHPYDEQPLWEVPVFEEVGDPAFSDYYRSSYTIGTILQEMAENTVDPAHFRYVHGTDQVAECESYETEGHTATMLSKQAYVTPRGVTEGRIDVYSFGPGVAKTWFTGIVDALLVATSTPIDRGSSQVRFNFTVRKFDDERMTSTVAEAFVAEINKQIQEDQPIWEHKRFLPVPALADTDGPIVKFRKWYAQFYAEPYEVARPDPVRS